MPDYAWIYNNRIYNTYHGVILQVNDEYLLRDGRIQNLAKDLR